MKGGAQQGGKGKKGGERNNNGALRLVFKGRITMLEKKRMRERGVGRKSRDCTTMERRGAAS